MIVKVQRSVASGTGGDTVLIYNRTRTHIDIQPLSDELREKMNGAYKCFFNANVQNGAIKVLDAVPMRDW